jgi:MFS family permease
VISAIGVYLHQIWMLWVGSGVIGGIGLGLGYISPVSTLIKWFPDRRGMATGMAIMGFGGGGMIGAPLADILNEAFRHLNLGRRVGNGPFAGCHLRGLHARGRLRLPVARARDDLLHVFCARDHALCLRALVWPRWAYRPLRRRLLHHPVDVWRRFATVPAHLADMFGTQMVGAIHGRLLTAWSAAGIFGLVIVNYLREYQLGHGVARAQVYDVTAYFLCGLLAIGFICNWLVKPVREKNYVTNTELEVEHKLAHDASARPVAQAPAAFAQSRSSPVLLAAAWVAVGVPLAWGVWITLGKAWVLFK